MADKPPEDLPDLGCATGTALEMKLLNAARRYAGSDDAGKAAASADYLSVLTEFLRSSGQLTAAPIAQPLADLIAEKSDEGDA